MKHLQRRHNKQQAIGILMVKVVGAKNLINADTFCTSVCVWLSSMLCQALTLSWRRFLLCGVFVTAKSDPFCIVRLGNSKDFRTKTINNNLNPTWNAVCVLATCCAQQGDDTVACVFCVLQLFQMKRYKQEELLYVQVMDADVFSSDPLGDACIRCGVTQPRSRFVYELLHET